MPEGLRHLIGTLRNDDGQEDRNEKMNFSTSPSLYRLHQNNLTIFVQNEDRGILLKDISPEILKMFAS